MAVVAAKVTSGPDLAAVGHAARVSKATAGPPKELVDFTVRKGDNGGVLVTTTHKAKVPEGRRVGAGFPMTIDTKDNPFGPDDGQKATAFVTGLLQQMTGGSGGPAEEEGGGPPPMRERPPIPPMGERPPMLPPPRPPMAAAVGPNRVAVAKPGAAMVARRPLV